VVLVFGICLFSFQLHREYLSNERDYLAMALSQARGSKCTGKCNEMGRSMSRDFVIRRDETKRLFAEMGKSDGGAASDQDDDEPPVAVVLSSEVDKEDIIRTGK